MFSCVLSKCADYIITFIRDWTLFRGGGGSMIFIQGKRGHINFCTHVRELCYTKGGGLVRGEGQQKLCFTVKGEGQENLNMASLHLHQPSRP